MGPDTTVEQPLGPADEKAFLDKIDNAFHNAWDDLRKGGPVTATAAISAIVDALQAVKPEPTLGGMGMNQGMPDMESMAEDQGGAEAEVGAGE